MHQPQQPVAIDIDQAAKIPRIPRQQPGKSLVIKLGGPVLKAIELLIALIEPLPFGTVLGRNLANHFLPYR